jgi:ppGpp synthetase/RelA/SpoT-type nucleotidyltranferase
VRPNRREDILLPEDINARDVNMEETGSSEMDIIAAFLTKYEKDRPEWEKFKDHALRYLERTLEEENIPSQVIGRTKEPDSVKEKLKKQESFYRYTSEEHILKNMVDFVGLRVSAYFPDDQPKILRFIDKKFITIATVCFENDDESYTLSESVSDDAGKKIVDYINRRYKEAQDRRRAKSLNDIRMSPVLLNDDVGKETIAYIKQKLEEANGSNNSGLASEAYFHPESTNYDTDKDIIAYINQQYATASSRASKMPISAEKPLSTQASVDNYRRRFGGYTADHRWVILRPEQRDADNPLHLQPFEIQVRSVLMDSWIAINRNIEYKALTGVLSTQERRILDSIKGLAQTGELLLEQLHYANTRRLKLDQIKFERPEDVTSALLDYFEVDETLAGFPDKLFPELLFWFLKAIEIYKVGDLRLHLKDNNISGDIREDIAILFEGFPTMKISLHPYVIWKLFQTIRPPQVKKLWEVSDLSKRPFVALIERTLNWILDYDREIGGQKQVLSSSGYESLTTLLHVLAWMREDSVSTHLAKYVSQASLLAGLVDLEQCVTPFLTIALLQALLGQCAQRLDGSRKWSFTHIYTCQYQNQICTERYTRDPISLLMVRELAIRPVQWEHGVTRLLQYLRLLRSRMARKDEGDHWLDSMERTGDEINTSMAHWVAKTCDMSEISRIVHIKNNTAALCPNSRAFWEQISKHVSLEGFEDLIDKEGNDFMPWNYSDYLYVPVMLESTHQEAPGIKKYPQKGVTLLILDCTGLTDNEVYQRLQWPYNDFPGRPDVVFLRHPSPQVTSSSPTNYLLASSYYKGQLSSLATLVKRTGFAPRLISSKAGALGPLWKVESQQGNTVALVCDLLIHLEPELPPVRLRLPNCEPGTQIDSKFLPSSTSWIIKGRATQSEADEIVDPSVLVSGPNEYSYTMTFTPRGTEER